MVKSLKIQYLIVIILILSVFQSCSTNNPGPATSQANPSISSISPDSAKAGDTLQISGVNFLDAQGSNSVKIGSINAQVVFWSSTLIKAIVPSGASIGMVAVVVGGSSSNSKTFTLLGVTVVQISFSQNVLPVFKSYCVSCHGGQDNLYLDSYTNLMQGNSYHGPVVIPGNGEGSILIKKLRSNPPFGSQMPLGSALSDVVINNISIWVQIGAQNN